MLILNSLVYAVVAHQLMLFVIILMAFVTTPKYKRAPITWSFYWEAVRGSAWILLFIAPVFYMSGDDAQKRAQLEALCTGTNSVVITARGVPQCVDTLVYEAGAQLIEEGLARQRKAVQEVLSND